MVSNKSISGDIALLGQGPTMLQSSDDAVVAFVSVVKVNWDALGVLLLLFGGFEGEAFCMTWEVRSNLALFI